LHPTLKKNVAKMPADPVLIFGAGFFCLGRKENDHGTQLVQKIFKDMNIDEEWSTETERGFKWWGHQYAQRIWAEKPIKDNGLLITRVNAETELLKYPTRSTETEALLAIEMMKSSLSGLVIDPEADKITLRCSAYIHEENQKWLGRIFSFAAIMQVIEAENKGDILPMVLELQPDKSNHPDSGVRNDMDEMLNVVDQVIIPVGSEPFHSIGEFEFRRTADILNSQSLISTAIKTGLSAYLPFADNSALLQVDIENEHPELGKGLLIRLYLPPKQILPVTDIDGSFVMDLNSMEQKLFPSGHFLGSWCLGPVGENVQTAVYVTFIPAIVCTPGILFNVCISTMSHGKLAEQFLGLN
jgi:hypothetical protein